MLALVLIYPGPVGAKQLCEVVLLPLISPLSQAELCLRFMKGISRLRKDKLTSKGCERRVYVKYMDIRAFSVKYGLSS